MIGTLRSGSVETAARNYEPAVARQGCQESLAFNVSMKFLMRWLDDTLRRIRERDFAPVKASYSYLRFGDNPRYRPD